MDFGTRRVRGVRAARKRENINAHPSTAQTLKYYEKTRTPTLEHRYTGEESKVAMNSKETPEKMSNLEKVVNTSMKVIMTTMVILVVITNICASIWRMNKLGTYEDANRKSERFWYLFPNSVDEDDWFDLPQWLGRMFTYAILYNNFVPISLYVTLELINMYHAGFINNDKNMYVVFERFDNISQFNTHFVVRRFH